MMQSTLICCMLQLLKNVKNLKSDKSLELSTSKISKLESDLKEALSKIKKLESESEKDDKSEKKVRFGTETNKKDADSLKSKQEELDKFKIGYNKVIILQSLCEFNKMIQTNVCINIITIKINFKFKG